MQTRENAENVVFIQAVFRSQEISEMQFQINRQKNSQKASETQNADNQKKQRAAGIVVGIHAAKVINQKSERQTNRRTRQARKSKKKECHIQISNYWRTRNSAQKNDQCSDGEPVNKTQYTVYTQGLNKLGGAQGSEEDLHN